MTTRVLAVAAVLLGLGAPPVLGGTKIQMNIVPTPPDCYSGPNVCKNDGSACVDNSDCKATLSAASKFKIDGKTLLLKGGLKKVTDNTLALVTTDPINPDDDYMLRVTLCHCVVDGGGFDICSNCNTTYVRINLKNGNGNFSADLNGIFPADTAGSPIKVEQASVTTMSNPAGCTGDNSAAGVAGRLDDIDCDEGLYRGVGGIQRLQ